jgi:uncharacterized protein YciI
VAYFAIFTAHGPSWDNSRSIREQRAWEEHAAFMDALVDDGFVIMGGPLADGQRTLLIIEARDEEEVKGRLAEDPWASLDLLRVGLIEAWTVWLDARRRGSRGL